MPRLFRIVCAGIALALPLVPAGTAAGDEEKTPTIKEIMQQAHSCRSNSLARIREQINRDDPNWTVLENRAEDLMRFGKQLAANTPPKGTTESWERLTAVYTSHATLLADAAHREDRETAGLHLKKLSSMCAACHKAHRGR